jgi:hypothetical protein
MKNHGDNVNHVLNIILSYCCSVQTLWLMKWNWKELEFFYSR